MRLLVSVRDPEEALLAARHGADFIDCKEPRAGALGGLPVRTIRAIVAALRAARCALPVSATIGDWRMRDVAGIVAQARAVAGCGVDYVKVGIEREAEAPAVLDALATLDMAVVPVFIADRGLDFDCVRTACDGRFPAVMVDTADKLAGSLFDALPPEDLRRFVDIARSTRTGTPLVGLAGALRAGDAEALSALAPDFAGFRSAVCDADRTSSLSADRLERLAAAMRQRAR